jgi:hypothetical protein
MVGVEPEAICAVQGDANWLGKVTYETTGGNQYF